MSKRDMIDVIIRQYGGCIDPGINWTWAIFHDDFRGRFAFAEVTERFPDLDHRGYYKTGVDGTSGFRFR